VGDGPSGEVTEAFVVSIVDGDTIRVEIDGAEYPLRYIGIDTAEAELPCAAEATDANRQLVSGASVLLERDVSDTDRFDRLLRYVWVQSGADWLLVNRELVRQGVAASKAYPPDTKYQDLLDATQREAVDVGRGCLWNAPAPTPTPAFSIVPLIPQVPAPTPQTGAGCDPSYPSVCMPPYPPDLDCGDITFRRFAVVPPDPHGFDADGDGIGCESG
jgi:micrococcal nuclease